MSCFDSKGERFRLRIGPNYKHNKKKAPSQDSFYELVGMDTLKSSQKLFNLADKLILPLPRDKDDLDLIAKSGLPRIVVVNCLLPSQSPSLNPWSKKPPDAGCSVVFYFAVKPETAQAACDLPSASPALRLFHRFATTWKTDEKIKSQFKAIGTAINIRSLEIPGSSLVEKFNSKPVMIYKTGQLSSGPDYLEMDMNIHDFPLIARSGLYAIRDKAPDIEMRAGFVIQGNPDEELPECLFGCAEIRGLDFSLAKRI